MVATFRQEAVQLPTWPNTNLGITWCGAYPLLYLRKCHLLNLNWHRLHQTLIGIVPTTAIPIP